MKRIDGPGNVVLYEGRLARVIAIADGRTITLEFVDEQACGACGARPLVSLLEHSPLFQQNVEPVQTVAVS